ncbi:ornithine carbamoyltransferase [Desulforamulus hydrothermalis]|uniref:Ornithine carbamoyltransferase n=1 Tax=Desulforamulus hydrothermalis Lam5 = DSM 18033 TaxID=1121428 RepID=K8DYF0_9FIRM|nr:ornithine carbamoyltransferase [Desulforamulus hydrothermalis]CCO07844.1 ornithine carbamoyltransferase 2, chain F; CP4-6 prophage [Desulforamulus hydrothermalis Lam5 = DSM 18033]SHH27530.1 ornithine carbamoyltransferase [Desulforamulus hydrothermalis Lam5 = DSM 18033]
MKELRTKLKGRDLLSLRDLTGEEIHLILEEAARLKAMQKAGIPHPYLRGKTLAMIFQKSSTRTRVSFEVGMYQLGGYALFLSPKDIQMGRGESVADTARVLSRMVDGIMIRTYQQSEVEELARYADVPVINGLTDLTHPCQILADLLTVQEHKGKLQGLKLAYVGDGNNIAHSLLLGCAKVGMNISVASPAGYRPKDWVVELARQEARATGAQIQVTGDPVAAVQGADVIVTDVWASMGQESEQQERVQAFAAYQVNEALCAQAKSDFIFLHCLPAHRGEEVTSEIIDGPHSVVWDEAENRLHAQKAVMALLM